MENNLSVLIPTCGRPRLLARCLDSLRKQTVLPDRVVVIDNGSGKDIKEIIGKFRSYFKIDYFFEKKIGRAFARNRALKEAKGEILAFIDDDCLADINWISNIIDHFARFPETDGVLGKSKNLLSGNIYANIFQCYYQRWLMENFEDVNNINKLTGRNNFFDTKNIALKKKIVKGFTFDTGIAFPNSTWKSEDTIAGDILLRKGTFYFRPDIVVFHKNPDKWKELSGRNFIQGKSERLILMKKGIDTRKKMMKYSYLQWLQYCNNEIVSLNLWSRLVFWLNLFIYPISYKIGRFSFLLR